MYRCDPKCKTCIGPANTDCVPNYFHVAATLSGSEMCQPCAFPCATCRTTANTCTSCTSNLYLQNSLCVWSCESPDYGVLIHQKLICQKTCPSPQFKHDIDRVCYTLCPSIYYGDPLSGKCTIECPSSMYGDATTKQCKFCDFDCLTCSLTGNKCTTCPDEWIMQSEICVKPECIVFFILFIN